MDLLRNIKSVMMVHTEQHDTVASHLPHAFCSAASVEWFAAECQQLQQLQQTQEGYTFHIAAHSP
jgi:hypothetical protein